MVKPFARTPSAGARTPSAGRRGRWGSRTVAAVLLTGALVAVPGTAYAGDDKLGGGAGAAPSDPGNSIQLSRTLGCLFPSGAKTISVPGGSTSQIRANGRSTIIADYIPLFGVTGVKFNSNSASTNWLGLTPFYYGSSVSL